MLKLKGEMPVSFFTLEVDLEFETRLEVEKFLDWTERLRRWHRPRRDVKKWGRT